MVKMLRYEVISRKHSQLLAPVTFCWSLYKRRGGLGILASDMQHHCSKRASTGDAEHADQFFLYEMSRLDASDL